MNDGTIDLSSELASSATTFTASCGIVSIFLGSVDVVDLILLVVANVIPSRVGLRIGALAAVIFGPTGNTEFYLTRENMTLSAGFVTSVLYVEENAKVIFGIGGGVIGLLTYGMLKQIGVARFWSNILSGTAVSVCCGILMGFLLVVAVNHNAIADAWIIEKTYDAARQAIFMSIPMGFVAALVFSILDVVSRAAVRAVMTRL